MKIIVCFMMFVSLATFSQSKDSLKDFRLFYKEKTNFQDFIRVFNNSFNAEAKKSNELQLIGKKINLDINSIEALLLIYANSSILKLSAKDKLDISNFLSDFSFSMLSNEKAFVLVLNSNKNNINILAVPQKNTGRIKNLYILQIQEDTFLKSDELNELLTEINTKTKKALNN